MKNLILIETAKELIEFANRNRSHSDDQPCLPMGAKLSFHSIHPHVRLEADGFVLDKSVTHKEVIAALTRATGLVVEFKGPWWGEPDE